MSRIVVSSRPSLPLLLVAALVACGHEEPAAPATHIDGLQTFQVQVADAPRGRAWEGVVEAVRQATLSAQTNGRVIAVSRDVNDRVAAGDVLVRLVTSFATREAEIDQLVGIAAKA